MEDPLGDPVFFALLTRLNALMRGVPLSARGLSCWWHLFFIFLLFLLLRFIVGSASSIPFVLY